MDVLSLIKKSLQVSSGCNGSYYAGPYPTGVQEVTEVNPLTQENDSFQTNYPLYH